MWEEWRAHIDKTVRDAELGRVERGHEQRAFRDFSLSALKRSDQQDQSDLPRQLRLRLVDARARPIL